MIDAPLALAFTAGMVATVNPCGFAMLPAYLSFFVTVEGDRQRPLGATVARSLAIGGVLTAGFATVFAVPGLILTGLRDQVQQWSQWGTTIIGAVLIVLGVLTFRGWKPRFATPQMSGAGRERTMRSMFLFGVSYAVASFSCTGVVFFTVVAGTTQRANLISGVAAVAAFCVGMGLVITVLTVTLGLSRQGLVRHLRRLLPYMDRAAGILLVTAGAWLIYYWGTDARTTGGGLVDLVEGWSTDISRRLQDIGESLSAAASDGAVIAVAGLVALGVGVATYRRLRRPERTPVA